jgi:L-aspartate oxidase
MTDEAVTRRMTKQIIDRFEAVQIKQMQGERLIATTSAIATCRRLSNAAVGLNGTVGACSGVHAATRLASNSLLEGLVFSARIAADISNNLPEFSEPVANNSAEFLLDPSVRKTLQASMSRGAGVLRSADSLIQTSNDLSRIESHTSTVACVEAWETTNLFQLANTILRAALIRQETRGSHWREDFPKQSDDWHKRIVQQMDQSGQWRTEYQEVNHS